MTIQATHQQFSTVYHTTMICHFHSLLSIKTSPITYHNINIGRIHAVLWLVAFMHVLTIMFIVGCPDVNSSSLRMSSNFGQAPGINLSLSCVLNQSIQIIIACQDDGRWEPNPQPFHLLCEFHDSDDQLEGELCF